MTVMDHPATAGPDARAYGGFWIRLLAFMVDGLVIGALVAFVTLLAFGRDAAQTWALPTLETAVGFVYLTTCWSGMGGGRTLGMRLFGLRVVRADGARVGYASAVGRWIGIVLSAFTLLLGLAWIAVDPRKQGWHDKLAGTIVVRDPPYVQPDGSAATAASTGVTSRATARPVTRALTVVLGMIGSGLAAAGVIRAVQGDAVLDPDANVLIIGGLAATALVGALLAWFRPGISSILFAATAVVLGLAMAPLVGPWYDGLLAATALGPTSENAYWFSAPGIAILFLSGIVLLMASVAALAGSGGDGEVAA